MTFQGRWKTISGEVHPPPPPPPLHTHLPSKSGYAQAEQSSLKIELFCFCEEFKVLFTGNDRLNAAQRISTALE
jgi:hypothetical protein